MARVLGIGGTLTVTDQFFRNIEMSSDINEHLCFMVDVCIEVNAKKIIELGVRQGVSTTAWLHGLDQTDGHLWSVDIAGRPEVHSSRWTFIQGSDTDVATLDQLPDEVDVVFIDTSHTYAHTVEELALYFPRVVSGGRIVLHDTEVESPDGTDDNNYPVKRAVEQFCDANGLTWSNRTNNNGLACIEIP